MSVQALHGFAPANDLELAPFAYYAHNWRDLGPSCKPMPILRACYSCWYQTEGTSYLADGRAVTADTVIILEADCGLHWREEGASALYVPFDLLARRRHRHHLSDHKHLVPSDYAPQPGWEALFGAAFDAEVPTVRAELHELMMLMHATPLTERLQWANFSLQLGRLILREVMQSQGSGAHFQTPIVLEKLRTRLSQDLDQRLDLGLLAQEAGMERTVMIRRFRKIFGVTPSVFRKARRMALARELLRSSELPIAAIAQQSGFTPRALRDAFTRVHGCSPHAWRQQPMD